MIKIDGKGVSQKILAYIRKEHDILKEKYGRSAGLGVIIVGDNPASKVYVNNKIKACENVGFYSETISLGGNITEKDLIKEIERLNKNNKIDGILVQLPLPNHINELKITETIFPEKDVDGFHPLNIGKMVIGDNTGFLPCTPYGIIQLFEEYGIDPAGKDTVIIGRSNIVGKPAALMLIQRGATVQVCNTKTKNINEKLKNADIIISAAGVPNLIKGTDVKEGAVVIDVGINRVKGKLCGDVNYEEASEKVGYITPVPGGVGPMTIAGLIKNTFKSYINKVEK
ncbi:bifunctional 5,10-methylenetetrahydrofolate dehydrogenase/5,10-methenyltetrahydrofolate cyclohydrolase [Leptotrichia sp. OH3620_COT-345]|uniref:bifunctional 5,10-methylenetetrahydrofolate dehydrogenase/5,10-methenyltetrahydrofolate cyclohydrolase n=1 Tax=Leptotrichia sp. OH3620_COT-345 TaxID=2491048 RepID=UPI000F64A82C|nr:bifunctional 5,10-methylenetetrahydrofolate dehydrogenase/5,10-methenyltetrahydrofolate cyclohydrolase [Leptotrichia sp. OH3620_COT-345]RRD39941.1 bifunctional 5,10-methylenetetrahydrofolate dehydrogenase/5,10-methenyltetrahydrofolate cyclohydrolase [Leptotrichia sp. OH3620_COT-345]